MSNKSESRAHGVQLQLPITTPVSPSTRRSHVFIKSTIETTEVFDSYWRFAAERQRVFFQRLRSRVAPWTSDPVISRFRFTNVYRATDRVSQFLIRNVQSLGPNDHKSLFFRTILFKLFNRIDTWKLLEGAIGELVPASFCLERYDRILEAAMARGQRIYSAAYIMPSGGIEGARKHRVHLRLLESMMVDDLPTKLVDCGTMKAAFEMLRSYPTIGDFLAYQYVTDLNYSQILDYSEMDFVMPGPGARSGIQKCFPCRGAYTETDIIKWVADSQADEFRKRGLEFQTLWGRPLQLIDCQNLFCEVDKYARIIHPEIAGLSGRVRIKQEYKYTSDPVQCWLPPKWHLNDRIATWQSAQTATPDSVFARTFATGGAQT